MSEAGITELPSSGGCSAVLLTIPEVCAALALGRSTVCELIASGRLRSVTIGRARRVPRGALDDFVAALVDQQGGRP